MNSFRANEAGLALHFRFLGFEPLDDSRLQVLLKTANAKQAIQSRSSQSLLTASYAQKDERAVSDKPLTVKPSDRDESG
jgi:hypothetical protein